MTADTQALKALLERVRAATGPDREIDAAIAKALHIEHPDSDELPNYWPPRYTLDLSEARTLIAPSVAWWVRRFARGEVRAAVALAPMNVPDEFGHEAATEELAICVAALIARYEMHLARAEPEKTIRSALIAKEET